MSLAIRMSRQGRKKVAHYAIVVADKRMARDGRYLERVGTYTPYLPADHAQRCVLNAERIKHWLSVGALPSERLAILIAKAGLAPMPKQSVRPNKSKPKAKAQERVKEKADKAAKAVEAAAAPAPAPEAPVVEAPAAIDAPAA